VLSEGGPELPVACRRCRVGRRAAFPLRAGSPVFAGSWGVPVGDDHARTGGLGAVHGEVGVVEQATVVNVRTRVCPGEGLRDGHADAGADGQVMAAGHQVRGGGDGMPGRARDSGRVGAVDEQHELVAL
jgi:hypothetical protein